MNIDFSHRIQKMQQMLPEWNVDAILVDDSINLYYFTGLNLSTGFLLVTQKWASLFVDSRYIEAASNCTACETSLVKGNFYDPIVSFLNKQFSDRSIRVGFDASEVVFKKYNDILNKFPKNFQLTGLNQPLKEIRQIKDSQEIELLKKAAALNSKGFEHIVSYLKEGITEKELAVELKKYWLSHGADKEGFEPIIAFGETSSMPHYRASHRALKKNQTVLIDIGVILDHYHSDMTRTLFYGEPDDKFIEIYNIVKEAQAKAVNALKPGMTAQEIDQIARNWIYEKGYGEYFSHGLGHGVGLDIHELPVLQSVAPYKNVKLEEGMVVTVEPGIYLPQWGGIRIEDTVIIKKNSYEILTTTSKELMIVKAA